MAIKNTQGNELEMLFLNARENGLHLVLDNISATSEDAAVKIVKKLKNCNALTSIMGLINIGWILVVKETAFNMVIFIGVTVAFLWGQTPIKRC